MAGARKRMEKFRSAALRPNQRRERRRGKAFPRVGSGQMERMAAAAQIQKLGKIRAAGGGREKIHRNIAAGQTSGAARPGNFFRAADARLSARRLDSF